jgi:hypothetical protein
MWSRVTTRPQPTAVFQTVNVFVFCFELDVTYEGVRQWEILWIPTLKRSVTIADTCNGNVLSIYV